MLAPRVSVVLAVYNGERHLEAALRSVLDQGVRDLELIVIDDGSTDRTPAIFEAMRQSDPRIVVVAQQNRGLAASLNWGIAMARGAYVARQDADDLSLVDRLGRQVAFLDAHPAVAAVGTGADVIDEAGQVKGALTVACGPDAVRQGLQSLRSTPVHGSMMMRKSALDALGGYRDAFAVGQDYDLWLRMSERFAIDNLPERLYQWRLDHGGVYATRRATQLMYAGIALAFSRERAVCGRDSCGALQNSAGDLDAFAARYEFAPFLRATWGELLLRGIGNSPRVRGLLRRAVLGGDLRLSTLCLLGWAHLGLPWPGGKPLAVGEGAVSQ